MNCPQREKLLQIQGLNPTDTARLLFKRIVHPALLQEYSWSGMGHSRKRLHKSFATLPVTSLLEGMWRCFHVLNINELSLIV